MLSHGRLPMTEKENTRLEELLAEHGDKHVSISRRDPDEAGPLVVQFPDGQVFTIEEE